ncbi:MAG: hypothetical protein HN352_00660 [Bacteroidetes bacterium]|jgi:lantibiotic biosynthesis protein|nr:hypothetical protein [Bacteroidota bacterium]MBT3751064.1 hypothetical protein [Bacteroidota bacterium]MBT4399246.1 hypothetical protein [Bacteroidota bacterium]MBT4409970.1 hypothetical protein [Bacteroidota bacterium]MBT5425798.1 hypothetical protein [Bacteroidota bacterium]
MFSPDEIKKRFYPGQDWLYLKLYMGPETAEEWLCFNLPLVIRELNQIMPGYQYFFVRYLDPDFHIRLRIRLPHHGDFAKALDLINLHSALFLRQGLIWKVEIATYERETERYGINRIELFESAFCADSQFWLSVLPWLSLQEDGEEIRWRIAVLSAVRYFQDLHGDKEMAIELLDRIVRQLKKEQKVTRSTQYQIDHKFRAIRPELLALMDDGMSDHPQLEAKFINRSYIISELFEQYRKGQNFFPGSHGDLSLTDLIHLSLNRGLRARHRKQEYVIYYFIAKLFRVQLALV